MGWFLFFLFLLALGGAGYIGVTGIRSVPTGHIGLIERHFGTRSQRDRYAVSYLGGKGPQARVALPNTYLWLPKWVFSFRTVPLTHVPNGTVGLVVARTGADQPPGNLLADHVECDNFRDGVAFLKNGGQQGRQQQVLTGGYYEINPDLFEVITVDTPEAVVREGLTPGDLRVIDIPVGEVGVVITRLGHRPDRDALGRVVPGHTSFQRPWAFLEGGGQRGVQGEILDEGGQYVINPWFAHVVRIPTRILVLEWTKDEKDQGNYDISLDRIALDVQGHTVRLDMTQTVQITPEAAPLIVRRYGDLGSRGGTGRRSVQQFVQKELGTTVSSYFRKISAKYRIQQFITEYDEVSAQLADEVLQALAPTGVRAVSTSLEEFECDEPEINEVRRKIALQQERVKLERARLEELHARRDNAEVEADIERQQVALEGERKRLEYMELTILLETLGPERVSAERLLEQWVKFNVPQIISSGEGDLAETLLRAMPFTQAREMLLAMSRDQQAITDGQDDDQ